MPNFFDLVSQLQSDVNALDEILAGGSSQTVTVNGVQKDTISKAIADRFAAIQAAVNGRQTYATKADMDADTTQANNTLAEVWNDSTVGNNGLYGWNGAAWARSPFNIQNAISELNQSQAVSGFAVAQELKYAAKLGPGDNLFNLDTVTAGTYPDDNQGGAVLAIPGQNTSDFIPVEAGATYVFSDSSQFGVYYDGSFNWLAGGWRNVPTMTSTAPMGAAYLRLTAGDSVLSTFMVAKDALPASYQAYNLQVPSGQLGGVYQKIAEVEGGLVENDWYDPDLTLPYGWVPGGQTIAGTQDPSNSDLIFAVGECPLPISDGSNSYCRFVSLGINLISVAPRFSRRFIVDELGYFEGERVRVGFWYRFPDASTGNTRRLYTGVGDTFSQNITISDSDWHWHEESADLVVNSDDWQGWYIGHRDVPAGEEFHIRGLTITNLDRDDWVGERKSSALADAARLSAINLNSYVEVIPSDLGLPGAILQLERTSDQNGRSIIKSVEPIVDPVNADCLVFEGEQAQQIRANIFTGLINLQSADVQNGSMIPAGFEGKYFVQTLWLKIEADADPINCYAIPGNNTGAKKLYRQVLNLPVNEWFQLTTLPVRLDSYADIEALDDLIQINCTPNSGSAVIRVAGITNVVSESRLFNRVLLDNRAKGGNFYGKKWASYGDSITAGGNYQRTAAGLHGMESAVRGIGGTTVVNNGSTAWVDADGNNLGRPPASPPAGTDGVDYFTITSGMCTQQRIDTLPADADLVTVMAGTNDFGQNVPIGAISNAPDDTAASPTFYAAYKSLLDKLHVRCPNARIVLCNITSINFGDNLGANGVGHSVEEYREAIRNLAKAYGLPIFEAGALGVNQHNHGDYSDDGTHPNLHYDHLIGLALAEFIAGLQFDPVKGS